jgi:hypothetical protein
MNNMETTEIIDVPVKAEFLFQLNSKREWVNRVPCILPEKIRTGETWIWVDKDGYVFEKGADFMKADEIKSYPCKVYRTVNVDSRDSKTD